jgi:predicted nuclease with TOPRIM domain
MSTNDPQAERATLEKFVTNTLMNFETIKNTLQKMQDVGVHERVQREILLNRLQRLEAKVEALQKQLEVVEVEKGVDPGDIN